jgi:Cu(I)/Ag(I) efflux system membrane fusion protein
MKCFGRGQEDAMHDLTSDMGAAAGSLAEQKDINSARREFGKLSEYLVEYHRNHGKDHSVKVRVFVCDMAKQVWLQDSEELRNPYYGSAMLTCGRRVQ